jgi:hypothetical protein
MAIGVAGGGVRNSRTAWRNSEAPVRAASSAPPRDSTNFTSARAAARSSSAALRRSSATNRQRRRRVCRSTAATNAANRTRRPHRGEAGAGGTARRRNSSKRSSARAPRPRSQFRTEPRATPYARAIDEIVPPSSLWPATSSTTSTGVDLLGRAAQGRTRSRWPQSRQTASLPARVSSPSPRSNHVPVKSSRTLPQSAQKQPERSAPWAPSIRPRYVVVSQCSTCTTYYGGRGELGQENAPRPPSLWRTAPSLATT